MVSRFCSICEIKKGKISVLTLFPNINGRNHCISSLDWFFLFRKESLFCTFTAHLQKRCRRFTQKFLLIVNFSNSRQVWRLYEWRPRWMRPYFTSLLKNSCFISTMRRTMQLGPFAGPIYTIILIVDCLFFLFLEWWMPREDIDFVRKHWDKAKYHQVSIRVQSYTLIYIIHRL